MALRDQSGKSAIVWSFIWFRGILAPVNIWCSILLGFRWMTGGVLVLAFLSDWFDGVLARRWKISTDLLRRADSRADVFFYLNVLAAGFVDGSDLLRPVVPWLAGLILLEVICQITNYARFGCMTATHAYACKAWAVALVVASIDLLTFHAVREPMWVSLALGYIAYADVLAILWILPIPAVDVPSALHAWRRRADLKALKAN